MFRYIKYFIASLVLCTCVWTIQANAATITAASCSEADVTTAYNSASNGDRVLVPEGSCSWSSYIKIEKQVAIMGAGIDSTYIELDHNGPAISIEADNVRVTEFTFDCNFHATGKKGIVRVGDFDNVGSTKDFRIDNNRFIECRNLDDSASNGYNAIFITDYAYGVIDNNIFDDCTGECIVYCSDSIESLNRSTDYGQYTNGVVYIENNTWNYTMHGANAVDGNSGSRHVVRYNTFNISDSGRVDALISNHETGARCSGTLSEGDVGTLLMEIYKNDVYNFGTGSNTAKILVKLRGGKALIYDNTTYLNNDVHGAKIAKFHAWRSTSLYKGSATNGRGYSGWCHDNEAGYITEGREFSKTTLAKALDNSETSINVSSVTDFPTYGGSIIIGSEQIDYTGISGTTLTGCTRGANETTAASHDNGADVDLLIFGECLEQITDSYVWGNKAPDGSDKNDVWVEGGYRDLPEHNDYVKYDIQSYTERPSNWQYRNDGTEYSYAPYPYPHPLRIPPAVPINLRIQ